MTSAPIPASRPPASSPAPPSTPPGSDTTSCGAGDSADVWYSYTPAVSGLVEVNTCGSTSDTTLAVYNSC